MAADQSPKIPYHGPPSIGHEIGVMFGFMAFFVLAMSVYLVLWKAGQRRSQATELARREALAQRGFGGEKSGHVVGGDSPATEPHGYGVRDGGEGELVSEAGRG